MSLGRRVYNLLRARMGGGAPADDDAGTFEFDLDDEPAAQGRRDRTRGHERPSARPAEDPVTRAYRVLEVPYGSDFATVKSAYRRQMRDYHPDRFADDPDKQRTANRVASELSAAYELLRKHLKAD